MNQVAVEQGTVPEQVGSLLRTAIALVDLRIYSAQQRVDSDLERGRWSQVSGFAGQVEGLTLARSDLVALQACGKPTKAALIRLLAKFKEQDRMETVMRDQAVMSRRYADIAPADGRGTGYLMALKVLSDELKSRRWI